MSTAPKAPPKAPRQSQSGKANRWILYGPLALGALLFAGYSAAWQFGAGIMRSEVAQFIADQRAAGMVVEHGALKVSGYPFLLRAELPTPLYGDPQAGWTWEAGSLFVDTLPLNPTKLVFTPTGRQIFRTESQTGKTAWQIDAEMTRASLSQTQTGMELRGLTATPVEGADAAPIAQLQIGLFRSNTRLDDNEETSATSDIGSLGLEAQQIVLTPTDRTPITVTYFDASLTATALASLQQARAGQSEIDIWRDNDGSLTIEDMRLIIDEENGTPPTQLRIDGRLTVDQSDYPSGRINASLKDHATLLSVLEKIELLSPEERSQTEQMLDTMSAVTEGQTKAAFILRNGQAKIGPLTIADLPKLQ